MQKENIYKSRDWLHQKYWDERLPAHKIAKLCGVKPHIIWALLKKFRIKTRTISEANKGNVGEKASSWRGGRIRATGGYINIFQPNHPHASGNGYILEHRLVMEKKLGRYLTKDEMIHHLNGIKTDNREENLLVVNIKTHPIGYAGGYREGYKVATSEMTERLMRNRNN